MGQVVGLPLGFTPRLRCAYFLDGRPFLRLAFLALLPLVDWLSEHLKPAKGSKAKKTRRKKGRPSRK